MSIYTCTFNFRVRFCCYGIKKNITELNRMIQSGFTEIDCDDLVNVDLYFLLVFFFLYIHISMLRMELTMTLVIFLIICEISLAAICKK